VSSSPRPRTAAQMWNEVVCTVKGKKVFASDDGGDEGEVDDEV